MDYYLLDKFGIKFRGKSIPTYFGVFLIAHFKRLRGFKGILKEIFNFLMELVFNILIRDFNDCNIICVSIHYAM